MARMKQTEYQTTGDLKRVISLGGGKYAYLVDEEGKLNHFSTDDEAFVVKCAEVDRALEGRIVRQLNEMGWNHIADCVKEVPEPDTENN